LGRIHPWSLGGTGEKERQTKGIELRAKKNTGGKGEKEKSHLEFRLGKVQACRGPNKRGIRGYFPEKVEGHRPKKKKKKCIG